MGLMKREATPLGTLSPAALRTSAACVEFAVRVQAVLRGGHAITQDNVVAGFLDEVDPAVLDALAVRLREVAGEGGV